MTATVPDNNQPISQKINTPNGLFYLGILCLIPFLGAVVGLLLLLLGAFHYKDKRLILMGIFGIAFTIVAYSAMRSLVVNSNLGFKQITQLELNTLIKNVEFYKLQHGSYPDDLQQLRDDDKFVMINDPINGLKTQGEVFFFYEKKGDHYRLFSCGEDELPNTPDDLYPEVSDDGKNKIGWVK